MSINGSNSRPAIGLLGNGEFFLGLGCAISAEYLLTTARVAGEVNAVRSATLAAGTFDCRTVWSNHFYDLAILEMDTPLQLGTSGIDDTDDKFPDLSFDLPRIGDRVGFAEPISSESPSSQPGQIAVIQDAWIRSIDDAGEAELAGAATDYALAGAPVFSSDGCIIGVITRGRRAPLAMNADESLYPLGYFAPLHACGSELLSIAPTLSVDHWPVRR